MSMLCAGSVRPLQIAGVAEESGRSEIAKGLMWSEMIIGVFEVAESGLQGREIKVAVIALVELIAVGAVGAFGLAIELGRAGWEGKEGDTALLAGGLEL